MNSSRPFANEDIGDHLLARTVDDSNITGPLIADANKVINCMQISGAERNECHESGDQSINPFHKLPFNLCERRERTPRGYRGTAGCAPQDAARDLLSQPAKRRLCSENKDQRPVQRPALPLGGLLADCSRLADL